MFLLRRSALLTSQAVLALTLETLATPLGSEGLIASGARGGRLAKRLGHGRLMDGVQQFELCFPSDLELA